MGDTDKAAVCVWELDAGGEDDNGKLPGDVALGVRVVVPLREAEKVADAVAVLEIDSDIDTEPDPVVDALAE